MHVVFGNEVKIIEMNNLPVPFIFLGSLFSEILGDVIRQRLKAQIQFRKSGISGRIRNLIAF